MALENPLTPVQRPVLTAVKSGMVGLLLLVSVMVWYVIKPLWEWPQTLLFIFSMFLLALFLMRNWRYLVAERRTKIGINVTVMLILILILWGMVNYLSARHFVRYDWTATRKYQLSDLSKQLVKDLPQPLRITTVFKPGNLFQEVKDLLIEYQSISPQILVVHTDPDKEPGEVQMLADRLNMGNLRNSSIVLEYEGRSRLVRNTDLINYEIVRSERTNRRERRALFNGEMAITSAIMEIKFDERYNVYFTAGHGEKDIDDFQQSGLTRLRDALRRENYYAQSLFLPQSNGVPDDCDVLVIAGPQYPFSPMEVRWISDYLNRGGKLLALIDPLKDSALENMLQNWGIILADDVVIDPDQKTSSRDFFALYISQYVNHPITENIFRTATFFPSARSIQLRNVERKRLQMNYLLRTSQRSWGERNIQDAIVKFDPDIDNRGPLYIGVAVAEEGSLYEADPHQKRARLVVLGDSDFISNTHIDKLGNEDLILNSINWISKREDMIAIRAKSPDRRPLVLSAVQKRAVMWISVALIPFWGLLLGIVVWWRRRH